MTDPLTFYGHLDDLLETWLAPLLKTNDGEMLGVNRHSFSATQELPDIVGRFKEGLPGIYLSTPAESLEAEFLAEGNMRTRTYITASYVIGVVVSDKGTVPMSAPIHYRQRDALLKELHGRIIKPSEYPTINGTSVTGDRVLLSNFQMWSEPDNSKQISLFALSMKWFGVGGPAST